MTDENKHNRARRRALRLGLLALGTTAISCAVVAGIDKDYRDVLDDDDGAGGTSASSSGTGGTAGSGGTSSGTGGNGGAGGAPLKADGQPCAQGTECQSTICVDDVCCDDACDGVCEACVAVSTGGTNGTCAPIPALQDPEDECTGDEVCDGSGTCVLCNVKPTPPAPQPCPNGCSSCSAGVCNIVCDNNQECMGDTIDCPADYACHVQCTGNSGCENAVINCPATYACSVTCDGNTSCGSATIHCIDGACDLHCTTANNTCDGTTLTCGTEACIATCDSGATDQPTVTCGSSCGCVSC